MPRPGGGLVPFLTGRKRTGVSESVDNHTPEAATADSRPFGTRSLKIIGQKPLPEQCWNSVN
jgi:hypothetical protein